METSTTDEAQEIMTELMQTLHDGAQGFTEAADKLGATNRPDIAAAFRGFARQRAQFHAELGALVAAAGHEPEEKGTIAAKLHRGWMGVKDMLAGTSPDGVLDAAEQGEDHAVSVYKKACGADLPENVRGVVVRQFAQINTAHAMVKQLRDAA